MANLVREKLSYSVMGEVSITLFCKLPCLQSPQTTKLQFAGKTETVGIEPSLQPVCQRYCAC